MEQMFSLQEEIIHVGKTMETIFKQRVNFYLLRLLVMNIYFHYLGLTLTKLAKQNLKVL